MASNIPVLGFGPSLPMAPGHVHHRWLDETAAGIKDDYDRLHAAAARDPQRAGHGAESTWAELLRKWLPPAYEVVTRKYIIPEVGDDVFEIDVVVLSPSYPKSLFGREEIMAGGVSAAFTVKLTATTGALHEAFDRTRRLRRALAPRFGTPRAQIVGPYPVGLLCHSHGWIQPGSTPVENLRRELDHQHFVIKHPIEMIDYVCIADLGSWLFARIRYLPPSALTHSPIATDRQRSEGACMTAMMGSDGASVRNPIAVLVARLYQRLGYSDPTIRTIADGFRVTDTMGSAKGAQRLWNLSELYAEDVIRQLPTRGLSRSDVDWQTELA